MTPSVLHDYAMSAPDVVRTYKRKPFIIEARLRGPDHRVFRRTELFV